jgi:signal recognition particle subunit SRP54
LSAAARRWRISSVPPTRGVARAGDRRRLSLIERARSGDRCRDASGSREIRSNGFTLEDFRDQLKTIRKMGPLEQIMGMLPGMGSLRARENKPDEKQISRSRRSRLMTPESGVNQSHSHGAPQTHREGQGDVGRRCESSAEAVPCR